MNRHVENRQSGAIMLVVILVIFVAILVSSLSLMNNIFIRQGDNLVSKYYERAIASALSCREVAMARVSGDYLYRTNGFVSLVQILPQISAVNTRIASTTNFSSFISNVDCSVSIENVSDPADISRINSILTSTSTQSNYQLNSHANYPALKYLSGTDTFIKITSEGRVVLPITLGGLNLKIRIKSIVVISDILPIVLYSQIL